MCRLRTNFARLGDPLQGLHIGNAPLLVLLTTSPKGKHVTGFSGRFAPLRIQFLCHPGGGSLLYAYPPAERVILSRRRRISVHGDSKTLVDKYKSVGRFRRFRGW